MSSKITNINIEAFCIRVWSGALFDLSQNLERGIKDASRRAEEYI
jgi:hypothetical protein